MRCPVCGGRTRVIDKRGKGGDVRRRRECLSCFSRFPTYEKIAFSERDGYLLKMLMEKQDELS